MWYSGHGRLVGGTGASVLLSKLWCAVPAFVLWYFAGGSSSDSLRTSKSLFLV